MRVRRLIVALVASLLGANAGTAHAADPAAWAGFANAWIAAHAMRLKGQAPRDARKSCEGDLNGDGHCDVVVVYAIEGVGGGNDWTQCATVLTATPQGYGASNPREVGGKRDGAVESCSIAGAVVALDGQGVRALRTRRAVRVAPPRQRYTLPEGRARRRAGAGRRARHDRRPAERASPSST